jgi:hypothetical protein
MIDETPGAIASRVIAEGRNKAHGRRTPLLDEAQPSTA